MNTYFKIGNFVLFQLGWFTCVMGAAKQMPMAAVASVIIILAVHFVLISARKQEIMLLCITGLLGFVNDSINLQIGALNLAHGHVSYFDMAPLWLVGLWMLFASTLNHSMNWLNGKPILASMLGAVFAPLAYYAGAQIGALNLNTENPAFSMLLIGAEWAIITPTLFWLKRKINVKKQQLSSQQTHA